MKSLELIPVHCFLHRIFPIEFYEDTEKLVNDRVFKPRKDSEPLLLTFPLDWESKERVVDRNWRMQLQGWTFLHPIMNIFDNYKKKDDILDFFFDAITDWWRFYGQDPEDIVTTRMPKSYAWYDMSVGFRALAITFFINRITCWQMKISKERSKLLEEVAVKHIRHLLKPIVFSMNNHGLFQSHGLVGLLKTSPHLSESLDSDLEYAIGLVEQLIISQFSDLGVHLEHSPHYHFYALNTLQAQIDSGWYHDRPRIITIAANANNNSKWLLDPFKRPVCVGDSILTVQKDIEFPNTHHGKYIHSKISHSGYSVVRSGWGECPEISSMLFFTGAYHSKSHKHRDCLSFDWFDRGARIICDSGKYGYKSDVYRNYFLSTRAHNSVEIEGFDILTIKPYGSIVENPKEIKQGLFYLKGTLDYPAVKHCREIYFKPGNWVLIKDSLSFARARGFKQWFHLNKGYCLENIMKNFACFRDGNGTKFLIECLDKELNVELHYGDSDNMQGFICEKDYQFMPSFAVGFSGQGKKKEVFTILSLSKNAHDNAKKFLSSNLSINVGESTDSSNEHKKEIILGVENKFFEDCSAIICSDVELSGEKTFQVFSNDILFSFYGSFKENSKKMAVFLPGATSRKHGEYDFQRYSWGRQLVDFDCIFFSDPSIKIDNDLTLGWFQYAEDNYGIEALKNVLDALLKAKKFRQDELLIFGSSGGGFVSLKLSEYFDHALVVAINPQLYLYNYTYSFYKNMLKFCYEGRSPSFIELSYSNRISFCSSAKNRMNPVLILQNIADEKHLNRHFLPLSKSCNIEPVEVHKMDTDLRSKSLHLFLYCDDKLKHAPPNKEDTIHYLRMFCEATFFV
ncbi:Heparinase II/III N-terminus [Desulfomicrobium apsheronum]|uniref:Heparinase II/III N-terminus n=1 Tax=Desulfomicrobium apsheronum TaxID=52560 RepID=A0A1I3VTX1_9BACT|nr:heparinase II/III family protein [Desulfomicrobium apsheronum]SFJ97727.1 Heparinase II/III N-terminus [Desulfomicrobium apsheronum]